jgi:chromodomain-helicase-DNA-binding protein 1
MLSDEYYEQDGEDQSDSLHYNGIHKPTGRNSWPQQMSKSTKRTVRRKSRISDDDGDGDGDYEEEDEVDGMLSIEFAQRLFLMHEVLFLKLVNNV